MKRSNKKTIAIFSAYIPPHVGGIERYVDNLSKEFTNMGYKVVIVTSNYNDDVSFEVVNDIDVIRIPIYNIFKNRYPIVRVNKEKRKLVEKLDSYDIGAIIVNTRFHLTSFVGVRYANRKDIPVYLIEHGSNYVTLNNKFIDFFANRYEDMLTFYLKRRVNGFYGVSNACGAWLSRFNIKASGTWYNAISFNDRIVKKEHKEINFLYAGRIIKQKGVYNILVSFSKLSLKYKNIHLYIAGDGEELEMYKSEFVDDRIHFLGRLEFKELLDYYAICDVFLYPPLWPEGLPTSILEAGMMRCAVIGTNQGGITEIITNNKDGLIASGDCDSLKRAMERLVLDDDLRKRLANNLEKKVKDNFSFEVTAKKILKDIGL